MATESVNSTRRSRILEALDAATTSTNNNNNNVQSPPASITPTMNEETVGGVAHPDEVPSSHNTAAVTPPAEAAPNTNDDEPAPPVTLEDTLELIPRLITRDLRRQEVRELAKALRGFASVFTSQEQGGTRTEDETDENRKSAFECGGHAALMFIFQDFQHSKRVNQGACLAIARLTFQLPQDLRMAAGKIGIVEAILDARDSFPTNERLQENAIAAIDHLVVYCRANCKRFAKAKGIEALLGTMTAFPANADIQIRGCHIMCYCVSLLNNQDQLMDLDALAVVSRAIQQHRGSEKVVEMAQRAFNALTKKHKTCVM